MEIENISSRWNIVLNQYYSLLDDPDSDLYQEKIDSIVDFLADTLKYIFAEAKVRDKWIYKFSISGVSISVDAHSETQNQDYTLGLYNHEIYLSSYIMEAQNIRYMTDEFFGTLSTLSLIKGFEFKDNAVLPQSILFNTKIGKSNIYRLVRNYILFEEHQPESTCDLGCFEATWSLSDPIDTIVPSAIQVAKGIHRLNYLLYRSEYQKTRR